MIKLQVLALCPGRGRRIDASAATEIIRDGRAVPLRPTSKFWMTSPPFEKHCLNLTVEVTQRPDNQLEIPTAQDGSPFGCSAGTQTAPMQAAEVRHLLQNSHYPTRVGSGKLLRYIPT
jgi:hypothetical protein